MYECVLYILELVQVHIVRSVLVGDEEQLDELHSVQRGHTQIHVQDRKWEEFEDFVSHDGDPHQDGHEE